nr:MAG TPA: hypothetical protein [Caudoviricetes sp.]
MLVLTYPCIPLYISFSAFDNRSNPLLLGCLLNPFSSSLLNISPACNHLSDGDFILKSFLKKNMCSSVFNTFVHNYLTTFFKICSIVCCRSSAFKICSAVSLTYTVP